jgi:hypothetical protein
MYPATPPVPVRSIRGSARVAVVMLAIDSLVGVVAAVISAQRAAFIDRLIADPESVDPTEVEASDSLYALSGVVELTVYAVTVVAFLVWLFRARANADLLAPWPHRRAKPWLIFGWFVPIVNWWFPKQIVDDIWNSSKPGALYPTHNFAVARRSGLVWAWWIAWLISALISEVVARLLFRDDLQSMRDAARFDVVSIGLSIVAAVLAAMVVIKITRFQEDHRRAVASQPLITA